LRIRAGQLARNAARARPASSILRARGASIFTPVALAVGPIGLGGAGVGAGTGVGGAGMGTGWGAGVGAGVVAQPAIVKKDASANARAAKLTLPRRSRSAPSWDRGSKDRGETSTGRGSGPRRSSN